MPHRIQIWQRRQSHPLEEEEEEEEKPNRKLLFCFMFKTPAKEYVSNKLQIHLLLKNNLMKDQYHMITLLVSLVSQLKISCTISDQENVR